VRAWSDRNGSLDGIEAGKLNREFSDLRKPFENALTAKMPQVQQYASVDTAAFKISCPMANETVERVANSICCGA
jgi:hypothetical protein